MLGATLLAGYNLLRFGSVFEFGMRYQLTGPMTGVYQDAFSLSYLLPNLYGYLMRPPRVESHFPFLIAPFVSENMWPFFIRLPENYLYHEPLSGFLVAAPETWFALTAIRGLPALVRQRQNREARQMLWLMLWLLGGLTFLLAPILTYAFSAMRFQMDFTPFLVILSVTGMWLMSRLRLGTCFFRSVL